MESFIGKFSGLVKGVLAGFDRIVFKGFILPLMSASEVMGFCQSRGILNKGYKDWMLAQTKNLITTAEQYAKDNSGKSITYIPTWRIRKEELAHERQKKELLIRIPFWEQNQGTI